MEKLKAADGPRNRRHETIKCNREPTGTVRNPKSDWLNASFERLSLMLRDYETITVSVPIESNTRSLSGCYKGHIFAEPHVYNLTSTESSRWIHVDRCDGYSCLQGLTDGGGSQKGRDKLRAGVGRSDGLRRTESLTSLLPFDLPPARLAPDLHHLLRPLTSS